MHGLASPAKSKAAMQSLRPVTIKQLLEANAKGDSHIISTPEKEVELGQVIFDALFIAKVVFVGCVRSLRETQTGADYVIEDGTGSISGKCWQDKAGAPVPYTVCHGAESLGRDIGPRSLEACAQLAIVELSTYFPSDPS